MTNDKIEQVAIALWIDEWERVTGFPDRRKAEGWPENDLKTHMIWRRAARTAIEAMREPTLSMCNAAIDTHPHELGDISPLGLRMSPQKLFAQCWRAMVDAARSSADVDKQENEQ